MQSVSLKVMINMLKRGS